jgi:predicted RNA-binding Zn-ribbon protein involved in translation (DUF1610 family)
MGTEFQWICTKCGLIVVSYDKPSATECPKGGNHEWEKTGATTYF